MSLFKRVAIASLIFQAALAVVVPYAMYQEWSPDTISLLQAALVFFIVVSTPFVMYARRASKPTKPKGF